MRYSIQPRDWTFIKGYGLLSFDKNMGKNTGKKISKTLTGKYSQKSFYHAKKYAIDALKTSSKTNWRLIDNKIADKITKIPKHLKQNDSETVVNEYHQ